MGCQGTRARCTSSVSTLVGDGPGNVRSPRVRGVSGSRAPARARHRSGDREGSARARTDHAPARDGHARRCWRISNLQPVLWREQEAERLRAVPPTGGRSGDRLVVRGEAGMGKTTLIDQAVESWADVQVLRAVASRGESAIPFVTLEDLIRPIRHLDSALSRESAAAIRAVDGSPDVVRLDPFTVGRGLTDLLALAADARATVVVIDDIQWMDPASAEAVGFAARRLSADPVAFIFAERSGNEGNPPPRGFEVLHLAGLAQDAAACVLRAASDRPIAPSVIEALVAAAGGNPLALTEAPFALSADQLAGVSPLPDPLPVGKGIEAGFADRLSDLPRPTREALAIASVTGDEDAGTIAAALDTKGLTMGDLDAAETAGIVQLGPDRVVFRHPLLRSVAFSSVPPSERRGAHAAVAAVLDETDGRRAWHLAEAATGPDDTVADALDAVGRQAARVGAHAEASVSLERAAQLTRDPRVRADRTLRAARAGWRAGNLRRTESLLGAVPVDQLDGGAVVTYERLTARVAVASGRVGEGVEHFRRASAASTHPSAAALALVEACRATMRIDPTACQPQALAREAVVIARNGDPPAKLAAEVADMMARAFGGDRALVGPLAARSIDLLTIADGLEDTGPLVTEVVWTFTALSAWTEALRLVRSLTSWARVRRDLPVLTVALLMMAEIESARGAYGSSRAAAIEAVELAEAIGDPNTSGRAGLILGRLDIQDDPSAGVPRVVEQLIAGGGEMEVRARAFIGRRHLWAGQFDLANEQFAAMTRVFDAVGWPNPATHLWEFDRVEGLKLAGRDDEAAQAMAEFEARTSGTDSPVVERMLLKCRALMSDAPEDVERYAAAALAIPDGTPYGRTSIHFGAARRLIRLGHRDLALPHLYAAVAIADETGAKGPAAAVRAELEQLGHLVPIEPTVESDLTPAEQRVLEATDGGGNIEEVAARLALSVTAVDRLIRSVIEKRPDEVPVAAVTTAPDLVEIEALGRFEIRRGGSPVQLAPTVAAAVKAVIASRGSIRDELLIDHFWPDADVRTGRARLRTVLARVRRGVGDVLVRNGPLVELATDVVVDAFEFEDEADRLLRDHDSTLTDLDRLIGTFNGPFLPGDVYETWAAAMRTRIDRRYLALLERGAALAVHAGELALAEELLDRLAALEPDDEDRLVAAGGLLMDADRRSAAIRFARLARAAVDGLGMSPSPALVDLEARISCS